MGGLVDGVAGVAGGGAAAGVFLPVRLLRSLRPWVARLEENLKPKLPSPSGSLKAALFFIGVAGSSLPFFGSLDFGMLGVVSGSESTGGSSVATAESGCWSGVWRSVMVLSLVDWLVVRVVVGLLGVSRGVTGSKGGKRAEEKRRTILTLALPGVTASGAESARGVLATEADLRRAILRLYLGGGGRGEAEAEAGRRRGEREGRAQTDGEGDVNAPLSPPLLSRKEKKRKESRKRKQQPQLSARMRQLQGRCAIGRIRKMYRLCRSSWRCLGGEGGGPGVMWKSTTGWAEGTACLALAEDGRCLFTRVRAGPWRQREPQMGLAVATGWGVDARQQEVGGNWQRGHGLSLTPSDTDASQ